MNVLCSLISTEGTFMPNLAQLTLELQSGGKWDPPFITLCLHL